MVYKVSLAIVSRQQRPNTSWPFHQLLRKFLNLIEQRGKSHRIAKLQVREKRLPVKTAQLM